MKGTGDGADAVDGRDCPVAEPEPGDDGLRVTSEVYERSATLGDVLARLTTVCCVRRERSCRSGP